MRLCSGMASIQNLSSICGPSTGTPNCSGEFGSATGMVDVAVGDQDSFQRQPFRSSTRTIGGRSPPGSQTAARRESLAHRDACVLLERGNRNKSEFHEHGLPESEGAMIAPAPTVGSNLYLVSRDTEIAKRVMSATTDLVGTAKLEIQVHATMPAPALVDVTA